MLILNFFGKIAPILKKVDFRLSKLLNSLYEIKILGWLVCRECGFKFVEQSENLERNELTLKNGQYYPCWIALATDSVHIYFSLLIVLVGILLNLLSTR